MKEYEITKKSAIEAGKIIKRYFGKTGYSLKGKANPVTKADIESQKIIEKFITKNFPTDSIIGEEELLKLNNKKRLWLVDPLDGTVNFAHLFPHFSVSICFIENGIIKIGIIYDPIKNELFEAIKNKGAFLNGKRIKVSKTDKLSNSLLATGFPYDRAEKSEYYTSFYSSFLKLSHDIRRCGAASLDMAWVACGRLDGYWEFNLKPWDVGAGKIIVEEAGGKVTDFNFNIWGKKYEDILNWGKEVLVTNGEIHKEMLFNINKTKSFAKTLI